MFQEFICITIDDAMTSFTTSWLDNDNHVMWSSTMKNKVKNQSSLYGSSANYQGNISVGYRWPTRWGQHQNIVKLLVAPGLMNNTFPWVINITRQSTVTRFLTATFITHLQS